MVTYTILIDVSIVDPVRVDAVPNADQLGTLSIVNHKLALKLRQSLWVKKPERPVHILIHYVFQKFEYRLLPFVVENKYQTNHVAIAFLIVICPVKFKQLTFLFVNVLSLEPRSYCLCCSFSVVGNGLVFVLGVKEKNGWESFHLVSAHELLVLAAVYSRYVHSLAN